MDSLKRGRAPGVWTQSGEYLVIIEKYTRIDPLRLVRRVVVVVVVIVLSARAECRRRSG